MSVLNAVAFLNGSDEKLSSNETSHPPPSRSIEGKKMPPLQQQQKSKPTTAAAMKELGRIRTGGGAGVASLLSRFGQEQQVPSTNKQQQQQQQQQKQQQQVPSTNKRLEQLQQQQQQNQKPSSIPTPSNPPPTMLSKTVLPSNSTTTPHVAIPSPRTVPLSPHMSLKQIDIIVQDLTAMYQESVEQCKSAQQQLKQLQSDAEASETDSTKVRDYEIRVEYLAQKLEQVSEEREGLEQELQQYRNRHGNLDAPVSFEHRLSAIFDKRSVAEEEDEEANNDLMDGILDAYDNEDDDDDDSNGEGSLTQDQQIAFLTKQLHACDLGAKMAVQLYLTELEGERQRTRTLQDVVKKQEALITSLESKSSDAIANSNSQTLSPSRTMQPSNAVSPPPRNASLASSASTEQRLRDQIESQRIELEDKRELLTQLLNERENMRKKAKTNSIDRLAELARVQSPSLSAPPRDPLPPIPGTGLSSPSKSFGRDSLSSFREYDDEASSLTSWSGTSDRNIHGNGFEAVYADCLNPKETNEHHLLALRMLTGS